MDVLRLQHNFVPDRLHAPYSARHPLGSRSLCRAFSEAGQQHRTVERFHTDTGAIDLFVPNHAAFDLGRDGRVVKVGAGTFLAAADRALYAAKKSGRNRIVGADHTTVLFTDK